MIQNVSADPCTGKLSVRAQEGSSFVVKDVMYDENDAGNQKAVYVHLDRFYKGLRVIGGDSVVEINSTDQSLTSISQTLLEPFQIDILDVLTANVKIPDPTE